MLYHTDPTTSARDFIFHLPTQLLAELLLNAAPDGSHILLVHSDQPIPDEVFQSIAAWLHNLHPDADDHLAAISRIRPPGEIPESLILHSAAGGNYSVLIHYPAIGFTAGIAADGTKIPPIWRDPAIFTPPQRAQFLAQAADAFMAALANYRQTT